MAGKIPLHKAIAMGLKPETGAGGKPAVKNAKGGSVRSTGTKKGGKC